MKRNFILLIICFLCVNLTAFSAQVRQKNGYIVGENKRVTTYYLVNSNGAKVSFKEYDSLISVNSNLFIAKNGDKVGLIDGYERTILPFTYQEIKPLKYGVLKVKQKDKYGLVNYSGASILPMKYSYIEKLDDRVLKYSYSKKAGSSGTIGLMNYSGKALTEEKYLTIDKISSYLLKVTMSEEMAKSQQPQSQDPASPNPTNEALPQPSAPSSNPSGKCGLIDYYGRVVLAPQYDYIGKISSTVLRIKKGNSWGRAEYYNGNIINIMFNYESYW